MSTLSIIIATLIFSAFFSGIEIAFVSSNKIRIEIDKQSKGFTTSIINFLYNNKQQFISTLLVGNNVALVIYGIAMSKLLEPAIALIWNNNAFILLLQTLISTVIIIFFAEFLPKTVFKINPNFVLRIFSAPLYFIYFLFYPVAKLTTLLSISLLRLFGVKLPQKEQNIIPNKIDLDFFIQQSIEDSADNSEVDTEVKIFQNALDFSNVKLRDCMIPRNEVIAIDIDEATEEQLIKLFTETGFSKIVLYRDNIDEVVGYIHSTDLFKQSENWKAYIRPLRFVPETMHAPKLMRELMKKKASMAIVIDEFGGMSGMVTLEDLVEEIFGDIEDEHDTQNYTAEKTDDDTYILSGRIEIEKANELLGLSLPEEDNYQTIAGFILHNHNSLPKEGETISINEYHFTILKANSAKIELVKLKIE